MTEKVFFCAAFWHIVDGRITWTVRRGHVKDLRFKDGVVWVGCRIMAVGWKIIYLEDISNVGFTAYLMGRLLLTSLYLPWFSVRPPSRHRQLGFASGAGEQDAGQESDSDDDDDGQPDTARIARQVCYDTALAQIN